MVVRDQGWFEVSEPEPGLFAIFEPLHDELVYSYLILGRDRALLFDTGMGIADLPSLVAELTDLPLTVFISHAHFDHVGSAAAFAGRADILVHPAEAERLRTGVNRDEIRTFLVPEYLLGPLPSGIDLETFAIAGAEPTDLVRGGDHISLGDRDLEVIDIPGHSIGQIGLVDRARGWIFSADAYYPGPLYAHKPGMDVAAYQRSLDLLAAVAQDVPTVYPSHNACPEPSSQLIAASNGMREVLNGRAPDSFRDGAAIHRFGGFSIMVPA